jgi:3alpha(or 20beta)-hydroxysteroid dehydrogenase
MGRAEGKVVVVTGAGGGQGAAEAVALAREGAAVVATDLGERGPDYGTGGIEYRRLDVSQEREWAALADWLAERHGGVDGLVNNAGIPFRDRLLDVTVADWDRVLAVNLTGTLLGIQALAPLMRAGGSIVNISSVAALTGHYAAAYTVSKWGVRGLSRVASLELGPRGRDAPRAHRHRRRRGAARRLPRLRRVVVPERCGDRRRRRADGPRRRQVTVRRGPAGGAGRRRGRMSG